MPGSFVLPGQTSFQLIRLHIPVRQQRRAIAVRETVRGQPRTDTIYAIQQLAIVDPAVAARDGGCRTADADSRAR